MARTSTMEEQMNAMKVDEGRNACYQAKIAAMRQKGMKKDMVMSFFETTKRLVEMDNSVSLSSRVSRSSCSESSEDEDDYAAEKQGHKTARDVIEAAIFKQTLKARPPTPGPAAGPGPVGS